jgi:hypothetical protein
MAGLVGMKTQRIRVGTRVLLLPLHHPVQAKQWPVLMIHQYALPSHGDAKSDEGLKLVAAPMFKVFQLQRRRCRCKRLWGIYELECLKIGPPCLAISLCDHLIELEAGTGRNCSGSYNRPVPLLADHYRHSFSKARALEYIHALDATPAWPK